MSREDRAGRGSHAGLDGWWQGLGPRAKDGFVLGLFALITGVFFAPFLFSDKMLFGTDIIPMGYAARKIYADYLRAHFALPLWDPYILGGLPFVEALHGDIFYPASILYLFFAVHRAIGMKLVLHVWVAGAAMYTYLRALRLRRAASTVGGAAYMFAPYLISLIYAGHDAKMYVTALFPFLLAALERLAAPEAQTLSGRLRWVGAGGAVVGLMLLSSHVQMAYFALWGAGLYTAAILWRDHRAHREPRRLVIFAALVAVVVALGLAVGMVQLLPSYLYTKAWSPRAGGVDYSFASSWSLHPEETVSLVLPEFGGYQDSYWGRNPFKLNMESPGTLVMLLGLLGLAGWRRWPALPAGAIGLFALAYGLGAHTPVHRIFYAIVPGVKFFRAPSIIMFLFSWGAATLAALALSRIMDDAAERHAAAQRPARKKSQGASRAGSRGAPRFDWRSPGSREFLFLTGAWWALLLLAALTRQGGFSAWCSIFYRDITAQARGVMDANVSGVLLGMAVAGLVATAAALALHYRAGLGRAGVTLALVLLVFLGDAWTNRHFVKPVALSDYVVEDDLVRTLENDHGLFRVLPATGRGNFDQNYFPIFGIQTANGFHDNRMANYDRLMRAEEGVSPRLLSLLNVKYLVTGRPIQEGDSFHPRGQFPLGYLTEVAGSLPRAFIVHHTRVMDDDAAVGELLHGASPLAGQILVPVDPGVAMADPPPGAPPETAEVTRYDLREIRVHARAAAPGILYFGDNYYPAWHAWVDGRETPVFRANVTFRGIAIPAGDHEVVFRYHSPVLARSMAVSVVACCLVVLITAGGPLAGRVRRGRAPSPGEAA